MALAVPPIEEEIAQVLQPTLQEHIWQRIEELECNSQRISRSNVRQNLNQSSNQALSLRCPFVFSIFIMMTISVCGWHADGWWRRATDQLTCPGRDSERFTAVWHAHKWDTTIRTTVSSSCAVPLSTQCSISLSLAVGFVRVGATQKTCSAGCDIRRHDPPSSALRVNAPSQTTSPPPRVQDTCVLHAQARRSNRWELPARHSARSKNEQLGVPGQKTQLIGGHDMT